MSDGQDDSGFNGADDVGNNNVAIVGGDEEENGMPVNGHPSSTYRRVARQRWMVWACRGQRSKRLEKEPKPTT